MEPTGPTVPVESAPTKACDLDDVYEIRDTRAFIENGSFQRVALQFPDDLLADAASVSARLSTGLTAAFFVLADTSFSSCCVDEIAAQHVDADCLIHYGHACLSPTHRLPVKYVFGRRRLNVERCLERFKTVYDPQDRVILTGEQGYTDTLEHMSLALQSCGYDRVIHSQGEYSTQHMVQTISQAVAQQPMMEDTLLATYKTSSIFYIGEASPALTVLAMTCHAHVASFYTYDPKKDQITHQSPYTNAQLHRRYAIVQKAKDASVIGIVVGTLGVSRYLDVVHHLRDMIKKANRKSYLFVVGKLTPAKLANFSEIELFVLVSCTENSLIESKVVFFPLKFNPLLILKDFYRPVATPYELYLALSSNIWRQHWMTDFSSVLSLTLDEDSQVDQTNEPHFSLITSRLIPSQAPSIDRSYHHRNAQRWYGLTQLDTQIQASSLETGHHGIACQYEHEPA